MQHSPPLHPSSNPAETFMRPLGKTMKIAHFTKVPEQTALQQLLSNYRDTPHTATSISPASMMFCDSQESIFRYLIQLYKMLEKGTKNQSKFQKDETINEGDQVLMRNHRKRAKFDPDFLHEPFKVVEIAKDG